MRQSTGVDGVVCEGLEDDLHVVDLLQAADGRHSQLATQVGLSTQHLHHTPGEANT